MLKNIYLSAALFWTCSILILCLATFRNLPDVGVKNADKYVHFTFHFGFVILWVLYFSFKNVKKTITTSTIVFIVSFLFGILIELAQEIFTSTRKADIQDVFANTTGAFFALTIILFYHFVLRANPKQR